MNQLEYFRAALTQARLFPEEAGPEQIRNVLEMFKAHTQVTYRIPDHPLPVRVALLRTHAEPPGPTRAAQRRNRRRSATP